MIDQSAPRILVVDDNDDNRYTLTLYLDLEGYTDVETAEGRRGGDRALQSGSFDLVLLDVMMPKVDGYAVLTWLKGQPKLARPAGDHDLGAQRDEQRGALHRAGRRRLPA